MKHVKKYWEKHKAPQHSTHRLQVIIVGNVADQVKFSELTLDMFRMLQTLEREPQDELAQVGPPNYGPDDTTGDQGNMDRPRHTRIITTMEKPP